MAALEGTAEVGLIGGTGLYSMPGLTDAHEVAVTTPFGAPSGPLLLGTLHGRRVAFLARHDRGHRLLPSEIPYRANVYALKSLGVAQVLAVSAVGSLREDLAPRSAVVVDQLIDRTRSRASSFFGDGVVAHVGFGEPFCPALRGALVAAADATGLPCAAGGTYLGMEGPQFSTRAESRLYRSWGCDVIGMTNSTEARLAREAEICYATLAFVTDYDAWREGEASVETEDILEVVAETADACSRAVSETVRTLPSDDCPCRHALKTALVTPLHAIPAAARTRLAAILGPYLNPPMR
jgi:5'-methylthioadenosine phosphorylase